MHFKSSRLVRPLHHITVKINTLGTQCVYSKAITRIFISFTFTLISGSIVLTFVYLRWRQKVSTLKNIARQTLSNQDTYRDVYFGLKMTSYLECRILQIYQDIRREYKIQRTEPSSLTSGKLQSQTQKGKSIREDNNKTNVSFKSRLQLTTNQC